MLSDTQHEFDSLQEIKPVYFNPVKENLFTIFNDGWD